MPAGGERRQSHRPLSRAAAAPPPPASPRKGARSAAANEATAEPEPSQQQQQAQQQQQQQQLAALLAAQGGPPGGWDTLPPLVLDRIFDLLDLKSLAAAASVCSTWRYEASLDSRWRAFWQQQVSDSGLWRWAKADGGYRQQLRAKQLVRRGDCVATVFPFSRRDGPVTEVLFFDGGPRDADKRILTVQAPKVPGQSVRVHGSSLKVWDAASLLAQRPLLAVHDVLKHLQLEDGRLFLWRVAGDAVVVMHCSDPSDAARQEEAAHWTEHPAIVASVLEPGAAEGPRLRDIPLEATFGRGVTPCDWLDMSSGLLAGSLMIPSQNRLIMRLFDVSSGRCLRASSCNVPEEDNMLNLQDHEVTMITTRSGDAGSLLAATCALFDTRVFMWRQPDAWVVAQRQGEAAAAAAAAGAEGSSGSQPQQPQQRQQARQQQQQQQQQGQALADVRAASWDPAAIAAAEPPPPPLAPAGGAAAGDAAQQQAQGAGEAASGQAAGYYEARHVYSMQDAEPIVDISISTTASKLFIVGMENIFVADLSGVPFMRVSMLGWRGVLPPGQMVGPADVGAFSWPLPNSTKTAFFLDSTNSVFICEFRRPQVADYWFMQHPADTDGGPASAARRPSFDYHHAIGMQGGVYTHYTAHTDLRAPPTSPLLSTQHGRAAGPRAIEAGVVEYSQDGGVLFTTGETACPAVAALLGAEKAAGTYLEGLGPAAARPGGGGGGRRGAAVVRGGRGPRGKGALAPRALVLIDTSSGCRYKAVPLEGIAESVHSAGQYLVAAVAELGPSYPDSLNGSIVVLDFAGEGFGAALPEAPARAARRGAQQAQQQQQRQVEQPWLRGGGKSGKSGKRAAAAAAAEPTQGEGAKAAKGKGKAATRPASGARGSSSRQAAAAPPEEEEAGPSRKRGRR
ncbi:hypothetical protein ABPG75_009022 [Micractinium tetrahymenae]